MLLLIDKRMNKRTMKHRNEPTNEQISEKRTFSKLVMVVTLNLSNIIFFNFVVWLINISNKVKLKYIIINIRGQIANCPHQSI